MCWDHSVVRWDEPGHFLFFGFLGCFFLFVLGWETSVMGWEDSVLGWEILEHMETPFV